MIPPTPIQISRMNSDPTALAHARSSRDISPRGVINPSDALNDRLSRSRERQSEARHSRVDRSRSVSASSRTSAPSDAPSHRTHDEEPPADLSSQLADFTLRFSNMHAALMNQVQAEHSALANGLQLLVDLPSRLAAALNASNRASSSSQASLLSQVQQVGASIDHLASSTPTFAGSSLNSFTVNLPTFNDSGPCDVFLDKLDSAFDAKELSPADRLHWFKASLEGPAHKFYQELGGQSTYENAKKALLERFLPRGTQRDIRKALMAMTISQNDIDKYNSDFQTLAQRLVQCSEEDRQLYYLSGLPEWCSRECALAKTNTLNEAINLVLHHYRARFPTRIFQPENLPSHSGDPMDVDSRRMHRFPRNSRHNGSRQTFGNNQPKQHKQNHSHHHNSRNHSA